jgi:Flp pilus assembly secretin CpaC
VKNDIQTAFRNEPTLTSSGVTVDVSSDTITLNGSVPSQKDRDEAKRIAQSFAGNRKVVDNVKVSGMGSSSPDLSSTPNSSTANPSPNAPPAPDTGMQQNQTNPEQPSVPKK